MGNDHLEDVPENSTVVVLRILPESAESGNDPEKQELRGRRLEAPPGACWGMTRLSCGRRTEIEARIVHVGEARIGP
jgi:hypothetical protein